MWSFTKKRKLSREKLGPHYLPLAYLSPQPPPPAIAWSRRNGPLMESEVPAWVEGGWGCCWRVQLSSVGSPAVGGFGQVICDLDGKANTDFLFTQGHRGVGSGGNSRLDELILDLAEKGKKLKSFH